jgi:putative flippase GtrA
VDAALYLPSAVTRGTPTDLAAFLRFCVTGGATALIYFSLLSGLIILAGMNATIASAVSFVPAIAYNYMSHKFWSFRSRTAHHMSLPRYVLVTGMGMVINSGIIFLGTELLNAPVAPAQAAALVAVLAWNYLLLSRWVFTTGHSTD